MTAITYFICGFQLTTATTIRVTARTDQNLPMPDPMPPLRVISGSGDERTIAEKDGAWEVLALPAGDHVLRIDDTRDLDWPGVEIVSTPWSVLVTNPADKVCAWQSTTVNKSDPKDPWPPPQGVAPPVINESGFKRMFGELLLPRAAG